MNFRQLEVDSLSQIGNDSGRNDYAWKIAGSRATVIGIPRVSFSLDGARFLFQAQFG